MKRKLNFYFSLLLHLLIFCSSVTIWFDKKVSDKKNMRAVVPAYVAENFTVPQAEQFNGTEKKSTPEKHRQSKAHQQQTIISDMNQNSDDQLLQLLHKAIAAQQRYPQAALELEQAGTVTIGFLLSPDGKLSQIHLLRSSGFASLDAAAVTAVEQLGILAEARTMLPKEKYFSVAVVFAPT